SDGRRVSTRRLYHVSGKKLKGSNKLCPLKQMGQKVNVHLLIKNRAPRKGKRAESSYQGKYDRKGIRRDCGRMTILKETESSVNRPEEPEVIVRSRTGRLALAAWLHSLYNVARAGSSVVVVVSVEGVGSPNPGFGTGTAMATIAVATRTVIKRIGFISRREVLGLICLTGLEYLQIEKQREASQKPKGSETKLRCRPILVVLAIWLGTYLTLNYVIHLSGTYAIESRCTLMLMEKGRQCIKRADATIQTIRLGGEGQEKSTLSTSISKNDKNGI
ncbi:4281_t:CDS:2, partial [Acaulospora colombiana]